MAKSKRETTVEVDTGDLLSTSQAAAALGVSSRTLERLKQSGAISYCSVAEGGRARVFYLPEQLDEYRLSTRIQIVAAR